MNFLRFFVLILLNSFISQEVLNSSEDLNKSVRNQYREGDHTSKNVSDYLEENISPSHIEKYIGSYATSDDFAFQEQIRTTDLAIKVLVKKTLGNPEADSFFVNGWGQVISAAYLLEKNPSQLKTSIEFNNFLVGELEKAIAKGLDISNPFANLNVRGFTKPIMMHPTHPTHPGKYFDWNVVEIEQPVLYLNEFVKEAHIEFTLFDGKLNLKINLDDESNIFNKLWETDFSQLLAENGYTEFEKNKEPPHVTLVNSNVIANVREQFDIKYGKIDGPKIFELFFKKLLASLNTELKEQEHPIQFTTLASTYSEDYSPSEEVIVAKLKATYVENALAILIEEVKKELDIQIPVQPASSFHLTIATKYRKPNPFLSAETLEDVISNTGKHSVILNSYWQQLIKDQIKERNTMTTDSFNFMTYNVNYSRRASGEYEEYSWENRRNDIYQIIKGENPSVLFLQEILTKNQEEVQVSLSDYKWHFESTNSRDGVCCNGIGIKNTFLPEREQKKFSYNFNAFEKTAEKVLGLTMGDLCLVNVHCCMEENGRMLTAEYFKECLPSDKNYRLIIAGDFNSFPDGHGTEQIETIQKITDTVCISNEAISEATGNIATHSFKAYPYDVIPQHGLPGKLDHIFVKGLNLTENTKPKVLDTQTVDGKNFAPSDHYPITATLFFAS
jgi:endonuclease/exonuclease/phosphatase family metal-dependent hydrolase